MVSSHPLWLAICNHGSGILHVWANDRWLMCHHEGHTHQQAKGRTTGRALPSSTAPCLSSLSAPLGICSWVGWTLSLIQSGTSQALHLPATEAHLYLFGDSCSLDKNTNQLRGARHCVCKVNQCAGAKKKNQKMCCWLTMACPEIKSRSVCGHKEQPDCLPSILLSFVGERVLVSLRQFAWTEVWQTGTVPPLK